MQDFLLELRNGLSRCEIGNERLLVAVSGGADSVALLLGLVEVSSEFSLEIVVAHLNHRLRAADSDTDAEWVGSLALSLKLSSEIGVVASDALSADASGLEEKARTLRFRFLDEVAAKFQCSSIALAHTADDQAETVLHHLLRGTGISGLCGIPAVRTSESGFRLVRPMLDVHRSKVEQYLHERGQAFRRDATNADLSMTRNRLRHVVLPLLREQINPQVDAAICRLAEQAGEIDEFLRELVEQLHRRSLKDVRPGVCRLDVTELSNQPRHVVRELFREIWRQQQWPRQAMGFEQWNRLAEILETRETITLPNRIEARFHSENLLVLRCL